MRSTMKWQILWVTVLMLATGGAPASAQLCGDADENGTVSLTDGVLVLRAAAGLGECEVARCDADGNGSVTLTDGVNVLRAAAGLGDVTGCGGGGTLGPRRTFLRNLTDVVILPGYRTLVSEAIDLEVAIQSLVSTPGGATLDLAQQAWRDTRHAWKQTEAFRLGPSESQRTSARIDWTAVDTDQIDAEVVGSGALSSAYLDTIGAQKVGFQAMEYFLFDPEDGDAGAVSRLQGPDNARRRAYLLALAMNVRERAQLLRDAWEPTGGNFGADFVASGIGGQTFSTLKEAFDEVVNRMIFTAEVDEEERIGKPLGVKTGGVPHPDLVEAPRSGDTLPGVLANVQGIANVYRGSFQGAQGTGLGTLVIPLSADIDADLRQLLDEASAAVAAVPVPLEESIFSHSAEVLAAYEAVQRLRRALTLDVASVLGVTLTFGGNDGD
jgi:uncharacterized protein